MKKINVAKLLKNCPTDMELDSPMYDNLYFGRVEEDHGLLILCYTIYHGNKTAVYFTEFGSYNTHKTAKCVIFPKGKTTWEGFVPPCKFKDGDIIADEHGNIAIYKGTMWYNKKLAGYYCGYRKSDERFLPEPKRDGHFGLIEELHHATEEEKQKLFDIIIDNGYHWNTETKTLEKLFPYNIGTKVWVKSDKEHKYIHTIVGISYNCFGNLEYEVKEEKTGIVVHYPKELLIPITTKEPKFKAGDIIKHKDSGLYCTLDEYSEGISAYRTSIGLAITYEELEHWELVPNKFDINTLKPFDEVLVRNTNNGRWRGQFYMSYNKNEEYPFECTYNCWKQCIPYENNEHLHDKTDDCPDFYKTWQ